MKLRGDYIFKYMVICLLQESDRLSDEELMEILVSRRKLSAVSRSSRMKSFPAEMRLELSVINFETLLESSVVFSTEMERISSMESPRISRDVLVFPRPNGFGVNSFYRYFFLAKFLGYLFYFLGIYYTFILAA